MLFKGYKNYIYSLFLSVIFLGFLGLFSITQANPSLIEIDAQEKIQQYVWILLP